MSGDLIVGRVAGSAGATLTNLVRGLAKAWVNLNGAGTIAILKSQNVSSATDLGTGQYSFALTSVMADALSAGVTGLGNRDTANPGVQRSAQYGTNSASSFGVEVMADATDVNIDQDAVSGVIYGDLA